MVIFSDVGIKIAETLIIRESLNWIKNQRWSYVITYAQLSVWAITDFSYMDYSAFNSIIYDCKFLIDETNSISIRYIS